MIFALGMMFAAITDYYTFTATTTTYTAITGTTITDIVGDDMISAPLNIGFTFPYGTSTFTQVKVCSNGFIALGTTVSTTSWTNDIASTVACPVLAPYYEDLTLSTGTASYLTQGTAPNRTFTVQFANVPYLSGTSNINFQAIMYENGKVELVYGTQSAAYAATASIGINMLPGGVNNFWSVTPGNPATASSTVANNAVAAWPATGTVYQFNPPVAVPNDMGASAISGNLTPSVGTASPYIVSVRNWGTAAQSTYQVKIMSGTTELASVAGPALAAGMTADVTLNWTPTATGPMVLFGKVVLAGDQNANNDQSQPITVMVQAAGTVAVTIGVGDQDANMPVNFYWESSLYECIYLASEIQLGGLITGLAWYNNFADTPANGTTKIWLGETANTDLAAGWIPSTQLTQVFDGVVTYPIGLNTITVALATPYVYGGGNLVMMVWRPQDTQYYSFSDYFKCQTIGTNRSRDVHADNTDYDPAAPPTGTLSGQFPKATFYFVVGGMGALNGTVTSGGQPLEGATVAVQGTALTYTTGANGTYTFPYVTAGARVVTCNKVGYNPQTQNVTIVENQTSTVNFSMVQLPIVNVTGRVVGSDQPTVGLANATVNLTGMVDYTATTNAQGNFTITGVYSSQSYAYTVIMAGYQNATGTINVGTTNYSMGDVTVNEIAIPATGVQAVIAAPVVNVTWEAPGTGGGEWIRWDTGENNDSIGTGGAADFDIASRWPVANLADYQGMSLYAVEYFPAQAASFSVRVWTGGDVTAPGTMVCDQVITNPTLAAFNTVVLDTPVPIVAGQELWFGIRCNATSGYPAGCDAGPAHDGLGNMMYFQGAWSTLLQLAPTLDYDWNLVGYVGFSAPTARPMALTPIAFNYDRISEGTLAAAGKNNNEVVISTNRTENTRVLTGYKVWRLLQGQETNENAWTLLTPNVITATAYTDAGWASVADGTYKWAVKAIYTNGVPSAASFSNPLQKLTQIGTISGIVRQTNNTPIPGATITVETYTATSNTTGAYSVQVPAGTHIVTCAAPGYVTGTQTGVVVVTGQTTIVNFVLQQSALMIDEGFEGELFPPEGWTQVITDTGAAVNGVLPTWCRVGNIAITPAITPPEGVWQCAMWWSYNHQEEWLKTMEFPCPDGAELRFNGYIFLGSTNDDHYYVKVSTNGGSTWTILWDAIAVGGGAYSDYATPFVISLDGYAGQNIILAWHADDPNSTSDGMWNVAAIDNVEVEGEPGANGDDVTPVVATSLNGNYPNPFNPETTISYSVKTSSPVAIEIYNTKGQRVRTLVNESKATGNYTVRWDGKDENGQKVTSGVYFYKMNAGKFTSSKKMILMK